MIDILDAILAVGRGPRLAIVLLGISSSAALAQPVLPSSPVPPPGNAPSAADIVVTGKVADPAAVDREAKSFERDLQATPVGGQLARWHSAICPKVEGVDRLYGDMVAARIRQIARTAGADVGRNDCRPNIVVTFTPDAKGLIASIEKRDPRTQWLLATLALTIPFAAVSHAKVGGWPNSLLPALLAMTGFVCFGFPAF